MGTIDNIIGLGVATVITAFSVGCAANKPPETTAQNALITEELQNIPSSVLEKFYRIGLEYFRGDIVRCINDDEIIFKVSRWEKHGRRLTVNEKSYYGKNGEFIGSISANNGEVGNEQLESLRRSGAKLSVDLDKYVCNVVMGYGSTT